MRYSVTTKTIPVDWSLTHHDVYRDGGTFIGKIIESYTQDGRNGCILSQTLGKEFATVDDAITALVGNNAERVS